jgi:hypothetical protein
MLTVQKHHWERGRVDPKPEFGPKVVGLKVVREISDRDITQYNGVSNESNLKALGV